MKKATAIPAVLAAITMAALYWLGFAPLGMAQQAPSVWRPKDIKPAAKFAPVPSFEPAVIYAPRTNFTPAANFGPRRVQAPR